MTRGGQERVTTDDSNKNVKLEMSPVISSTSDHGTNVNESDNAQEM